MGKSPVITFGVALNECVFAAFAVCLLVFSVGFFISMNQDTGSMSQIGDDWDLVPITDIQVANVSQGCPTDYIDLFTRKWPGTTIGCDCRGVSSWNLALNWHNTIISGSCSSNATRAGCNSIYSIDPINIRNLGGFQLCGKQSGDSFVNTQRPDSTGNCPDNFITCNPTATKDYKICRSNFTECPINDFKIVSTKGNDSNYQYRQVNSSYYVAFSYKSPSLSLNQFLLSEGQPCMDPTQYAATTGKSIDYKLEKAISEGCSKDQFTNQYNDKRYKVVNGFAISEYDLYANNGITTKLQSLPGYQQTYLDKKKSNYYQMYTRPTIFWSLACETREENPITRQEAQTIFSNIGASMTVPILLVVLASTFGFIVLVTVITNVLQLPKNNMDTAFATTIVRLAFSLVTVILAIVLFMHGQEAATEEKANAENLTKLAACSDSDTQFASSDLSSVYNSAISYSQIGYYVSIGFAVFLGLHVIFIGYWQAIKGKGDYVRHNDD